MRLARRLSDFDRSRGRCYFRKISVVLFHVQFKAKRYFTNVQSEVKKMAADAIIIFKLPRKVHVFAETIFIYNVIGQQCTV